MRLSDEELEALRVLHSGQRDEQYLPAPVANRNRQIRAAIEELIALRSGGQQGEQSCR